MKKTPIRIVVPKGKASRARYAAETTGPMLERLEAYFGMPFPFAKLDQLVIPQAVTFSAMENAGLVTWAESALLAPPQEETIRFKRVQASINAHEMAHQWFGDYVTLAWWDDVWLNESFATWMADRQIQEWQPTWGVAVDRVVDRSNVMAEDTLVSARKIRQEITTDDDIYNAFDGDLVPEGRRGHIDVRAVDRAGEVSRRRAPVHEDARLRHGDVEGLSRGDRGGEPPRASRPPSPRFLDQAGVPLARGLARLRGRRREARAFAEAFPARRLDRLGGTDLADPGLRRGAGTPAKACDAAVRTPRAAMAAAVGRAAVRPGSSPTTARSATTARRIAATCSRSSWRSPTRSLPSPNGSASCATSTPWRWAGPFRSAGRWRSRRASPGDPERPIVQAAIRIASDGGGKVLPEHLRPAYARYVSKTFGAAGASLGFREPARRRRGDAPAAGRARPVRHHGGRRARAAGAGAKARARVARRPVRRRGRARRRRPGERGQPRRPRALRGLQGGGQVGQGEARPRPDLPGPRRVPGSRDPQGGDGLRAVGRIRPARGRRHRLHGSAPHRPAARPPGST